MFIHPVSTGPSGRRPVLGGWFLLILFLQASCATSPTTRGPLHEEPGLESATVYEVAFLEPGAVVIQPVPLSQPEFQQALQRLARDVRWRQRSPREAAQALLSLVAKAPDESWVSVTGDWELEQHPHAAPTWTPLRQDGPVELVPEAEATLRRQYLKWCEHQGGGDCLGLLDDGPVLRADDRRALALALAFGGVLDETRAALKAELLDARMMVSMVVWTVALYCMMWMVPEPTTKAVAATLTVLLMSYLSLNTVYGLMDGWARMADAAHHASTFEELRAAGAQFAQVLGADAARTMILAVSALAGHTLGQVVARVKSLPRFDLAAARFEAQGGAAVMGSLEVTEAAAASDVALARAVAAVETVATSPQGPLAVVMLKKGMGSGNGQASGGGAARTVIRHRGGNRQVELGNGQRWHLPRGKSAADIPAEDKVGDALQEAVTRISQQWGNHRLTPNEKNAIDQALKKGEYWLARLLEREARGRFVHAQVKLQFEGRFRFNHHGIDIVDLMSNQKYEILSGTASNLARHGKRMASEFSGCSLSERDFSFGSIWQYCFQEQDH